MTDPLRRVQEKDRGAYRLETCIPCISTASDSHSGAVARVASAVDEGSVAIKSVHQYRGE